MAGEISIAYLIVAYTDPEHLKCLVSELTKHADVFIHINKLSDIKPFIETFADFQSIHRVKFIDKRYRVHWAGYSILKATFELLDNALATENYDRVILLTGQDFPVKSSVELQKFFADNRETNYINAGVYDAEHHPLLPYFMNYDIKPLRKILNGLRRFFPILSRRKHPNYIEYRGRKFYLKGTAPKWAITGECAKYLLDFYKNNPGFNRIMKFLFAPDDFYAATVIYYSRFQASIFSEKSIFYYFYGELDISKFDEIISSGCLYAKKFYSGHSDELINAICKSWEDTKNEDE
ncbi:MAG: hypothetical protein IJU48_06275 [Synergistaceae bacterium]|nr:hypothetical protein [Synergistaceae bacterium]